MKKNNEKSSVAQFAFSGFGAAPLWSSKCAYLTTTAIRYSTTSNKEQDAVITRFFGIFFMIFQSAQVWGNLISSAVLQQSSRPSSNSTNSTGPDVSAICGANDCGQGLSQNGSDILIVPEHSTVVMLVSIYLVCGLLSIAVIALLLDKLHDDDKKEQPQRFHLFFATLCHLLDIRMILIIPLTIYSGLEQGFVFADFTKVINRADYHKEKHYYHETSTSDCPGGNRNFSLNSNAQQIVRSVAIFVYPIVNVYI